MLTLRCDLAVQVLQAAVCPERRYGVDDELSAIATVTEVELSKDLAVAKIYISIYSDPTGQDAAWDGLQRLQGCDHVSPWPPDAVHACTSHPLQACSVIRRGTLGLALLL